MTTYASPRALSIVLLISNSILFVVAAFFTICGLIQLVGIEGHNQIPVALTANVSEPTDVTTIVPDTSSSSSEEIDTLNTVPDRFPSVGSGSVVFVFGCLSTVVAILGCVSVQVRSVRLLNVYGYCGVLIWFLKFLFIFATVKMHALRPSYDPLSGRLGLLLLLSAIFEFVLALSACHLAKIIKRGDAAEPRLQPLPVKI